MGPGGCMKSPLQMNEEQERQYELAREYRRAELKKALLSALHQWRLQVGEHIYDLPPSMEIVEDLVDAVLRLDESK